MGFKPKKKETILKFSDEDYEGLEIVTRRPTVRDAIEGEKLNADPIGNAKEIFALMCKFIIRWNLEDDEGNVQPINADTFIDMDDDLSWAIVSAFTAGQSVDVPLDSGSPSGEISPAVSVPMETL